jgi:PKD repeat protein
MLQKFTASIIAFFIVGIVIAQPPVPGFIYPDFTISPNTIYPGTAVMLNGSATGNSTPVLFEWNFGDGSKATSPFGLMQHVYSTQGAYTVSLKALTGYGDSGIITKTLIVSAPLSNGVTANFFYPSPIYENTAVQFTDNSSTSSGTISSYLWSLDGGNTFSATQNLLYTFTNYGQYEVTHKVINSNGVQSSTSKVITVLPANTITKQLCIEENTFLYCYNQGSAYQWQVSTDGGFSFQNIDDTDPYYSFSKTNSLLLNYPPTSFYGNFYRCMANATAGTVYKVEFTNQFTGGVDNSWENPFNWSCSAVPDVNTDVVISNGTVIVSSAAACRTLKLSPGVNFSVTPGFTLQIVH